MTTDTRPEQLVDPETVASGGSVSIVTERAVTTYHAPQTPSSTMSPMNSCAHGNRIRGSCGTWLAGRNLTGSMTSGGS